MKLSRLIAFLCLLMLLISASALTASAEDAETLFWYPVFYDDGVYTESPASEAAPSEAVEAQVVSAYAVENEDGSYTAYRYTGKWNIDGKTGVCTPIYENAGAALYTVTRSVKKKDGSDYSLILSGVDCTDLAIAIYDAEDGDRIVMQNDLLVPYEGFSIPERIAADFEIEGDGGVYMSHAFYFSGGKTIEFDVAGHSMMQPCKGYLFWVKKDFTTLRLFSSKPGALLQQRDVKSNSETGSFNWSGPVLSVDAGSCDVIVGSCCGCDGSNLTFRAGVIFNVGSGKIEDTQSSIIFDGITCHGVVGDSSALFTIRNFVGSLTMKNCTIYTTTHADTGAASGRCIVHMRDGTLPGVTKYMLIDNCRIYQNYSSYIANEICADATLRVTNTVGNYILGASTLNGTLSIGEGNAFASSNDHQLTKDKDLIVATSRYELKCNYTFKNAYTYNAEAENFADSFNYLDDALILDTTTSLGTGYDLVNVTWSSSDGSYTSTEEFIKGSCAAYRGTKIVTEDVRSKLLTIYFLGWDKDVSNVTEDITVKPLYRVEANVTGMKQSVTFSTDFAVNLYVPISDGIAGITDAKGKYLSPEEVELDGKNYYLVSLSAASNAVSDEAVFYIEIQESGVEATQAVTLSLLSYAESVLNDPETSDSDRKLVASAMLYAKASSIYFNGSASKELSDVAALAETLLTDTEAPALTPDRIAKNDVLSAAALELDDNPDFIFYLKDGFTGTIRFSYTVNGKTVKVSKSVKEGAKSVILENPGVKNLTATIKIEAAQTGASGYQVIGEYNLAAYVEFCNGGSVSNNMKTLSNALWLYANLAKEAE